MTRCPGVGGRDGGKNIVHSRVQRVSERNSGLYRAVLASLALAAAGLSLVAGATIGLPRASAAPAPGWTAYVPNVNSGNVTPIGTATNTTRSNIALPAGANAPHGNATTPDGKTAYVANNNSNNLTPIDTATNTAGSNIALPAGASGPDGIAITPDGKTAYTANFTSNNL